MNGPGVSSPEPAAEAIEPEVQPEVEEGSQSEGIVAVGENEGDYSLILMILCPCVKHIENVSLIFFL